MRRRHGAPDAPPRGSPPLWAWFTAAGAKFACSGFCRQNVKTVAPAVFAKEVTMATGVDSRADFTSAPPGLARTRPRPPVAHARPPIRRAPPRGLTRHLKRPWRETGSAAWSQHRRGGRGPDDSCGKRSGLVPSHHRRHGNNTITPACWRQACLGGSCLIEA